MRFAGAVSRFGINLVLKKCGSHSKLHFICLQPQRRTIVDCSKIVTSGELNPLSMNSNTISDFETMQNLLHVPLNRKVSMVEYGMIKLLKDLKTQVETKCMSKDHLAQNEGFSQLCEFIKTCCVQFCPKNLVLALKYLLVIGVSPESTCIETMEHAILEKIHEFDVENSLECLSFHCSYVSTDLQKNVVKQLTNNIQQSMDKINYASAVFKVIQCYHCFDVTVLKQLDFKLAELIFFQNPLNICKILCLLAEKQNRNKILLRAISSHIPRMEWKPDLKLTIDTLYALNTLNYSNVNVLMYLTKDRTKEIALVNDAAMISKLLCVCGHLRWKNTALLEACGKWILNNQTSRRSRELVAYVLTAAALNYVPHDTEVFRELIHGLNKATVQSDSVWLDVIWSLAILDHVDKKMLQEVLTKDFAKSLTDGNNFQTLNNKLKLLNLKAVMKNKYPECIFSCDIFFDSVEVPKSSRIKNCKKSIIDTLSNSFPTSKYLSTDITTDFGFHVDAEFILDANEKPLSMLAHGSELKVAPVYKPLPQGAKRFALLIWTFKDFTLNEQTLTGPNAFAVRLLEDLGYIVVQIPHEQFSLNTTDIKQGHYLQEKIKLATKECKS